MPPEPVSPVYAYVASTGDNVTGVAAINSASAMAAPFLTIGGAISRSRAAA